MQLVWYSIASTHIKSCALYLKIISGNHSGQVVFSKWVFHDYLIVRVLAMTEWNMSDCIHIQRLGSIIVTSGVGSV